MERRHFIKRAGAAAALAGMGSSILAACNEPANKKTDGIMEGKEVIAHYVLIWLKEGLSEREVDDFAGFFEELKTTPGIKSLHYGRAAATTPRDVVDNSFSYNLLVYFDSMDDINTYETHPIHLAAIDKYSKFWDRVVVHDSWLKTAVV